MKNLLISTAILTVLLPSVASATLINFGGPLSSDGVAPSIIAAPGDVSDDAATNLGLEAFDEKQGVFLAGGILTDQGVVGAGMHVDSHMIFLNSEGGNRVDAEGFYQFSGDILGVMSDSGGTLEAASSALLGAMGTIYPGAFGARGLETNDSYVFVGDTINLAFRVTEPGDWIRVITKSEVPEPSTVALLGLAAFGLIGVRRRQTA